MTSSTRVVLNSTASDLSLRAIVRLPCRPAAPGPKLHGTSTRNNLCRTEHRQQWAVISQPGLGHRPRRPGQPAFPAVNSQSRVPTDDCSRLTGSVEFLREPLDFLLEHPSPF